MNQRYWSSRIQGLVPYTPGEQPKDRTFIKLNTNENPYPLLPGCWRPSGGRRISACGSILIRSLPRCGGAGGALWRGAGAGVLRQRL